MTVFVLLLFAISVVAICWLWFMLAQERRSAAPHRRAAAVLERAEDAILLVDGDRMIAFANLAAADLAGRQPSQVIGTPVTEWIMDKDKPLLEARLVTLLTAPPSQVSQIHGRVEHPTLGERNIEANVRNLLGDHRVRAMLLTLRDVTANWELEEQLGRRAFWDQLTELPNRALFLDRVAHALSRPGAGDLATPVVLLIDIDDMQGVNEGTDVLVGDQLLRTAADRIRASVPAGDSVARVGGDTFAVLLEGPDAEDSGMDLARRLLDLVRLPMKLTTAGDGGEPTETTLSTSASIGIAPLIDGGTVASVAADATVALHRAKQAGPGSIVPFHHSLRNGAAVTLKLRSELHRALHRGEFHVAYQAIFETASAGAGPTPPSGFEALARWTHPELGPVSPAQFVPAAEASGLIGELGQWVLTRACFQTAHWNAALDSELTISVNVSGRQLADPGFIDEVAAALEASKLPAQLLILEITESVLVDSADILNTLARLRALGVELAIDDFGTGYSSLAYLQKFPVTRLKVDRSFTSRIEEPAGRRLVFSILNLAGDLGLATVAEGVETEPQLATLGAMGCDYIQGFLLGRPVRAADIDLRIGDNVIALDADIDTPPPAVGPASKGPPS